MDNKNSTKSADAELSILARLQVAYLEKRLSQKNVQAHRI